MQLIPFLVQASLHFCLPNHFLGKQDASVDAVYRGLEDAQEKLGVYGDELQHYARLFEKDFSKIHEDEIKSSGYVVDTLEASIWCLLNSSNYAECVLKAVNLGHDTDTLGAIAGSLAGAMYGLKMIPVGWIAELQNRGLLFDICECFSNSAQSRFNN